MLSVLINEMDIMGGTHKQVLRLCEYLDDQDVDFQIVTKFYDNKLTYADFNRFKIVSFNSKRQSGLKSKIADFILQLRIGFYVGRSATTVNVHDNGFGVVMLIVGLFNLRLIWQINDLPGAFKVGNSKSRKAGFVVAALQAFQRIYFKWLVKHVVDEVSVNVSKNADRVKSLLGATARVFYCGVDEVAQKSLSYSKDKSCLRILSTGVFFPYRNYETLVQLVRECKELGFPVELDIVGSMDRDPKYSERILNLIELEGLQNQITCHGQISDEFYRELFLRSDVFFFINIDQSWGLAVFEAMSYGLPVIVSDSVGAVEVLNEGVNSLIVDPKSVAQMLDCLEKLKNDDFRNRIVSGARELVNKMTWESTYSSRMLRLIKGEE